MSNLRLPSDPSFAQTLTQWWGIAEPTLARRADERYDRPRHRPQVNLSNAFTPWKADDDAALASNPHLTNREVARLLGRTVAAVHRRRTILGLSRLGAERG